jgi:hypothetical protein
LNDERFRAPLLKPGNLLIDKINFQSICPGALWRFVFNPDAHRFTGRDRVRQQRLTMELGDQRSLLVENPNGRHYNSGMRRRVG